MAAYSFNAGSGTTAADGSGNGNNGVLTNGPLWVAGKNGNGIRLDGVNDYVNLGNPASLRLTGSMTLSAWINSSAFPFDDAAIISKRQSSHVGYQLDTTIDRGPRTVGFKISDAAGNTVARYGATTLVVNTWYHVAGVYDATNRTMNVYVNGKLDNGALVGRFQRRSLPRRRMFTLVSGQARPGRSTLRGCWTTCASTTGLSHRQRSRPTWALPFNNGISLVSIREQRARGTRGRSFLAPGDHIPRPD